MRSGIRQLTISVLASTAVILSLTPAMVFAGTTPTPVPAGGGGGAAAGAPVNVADAVCGGASLNASATARVCPTSDTTDSTLNNVIKTVINLFSLLVGFISVVMIIFGGFKYITSGGDSGKITGAKNTILYALIGLVVVAVAQVIVRVVLVKSITTIV